MIIDNSMLTTKPKVWLFRINILKAHFKNTSRASSVVTRNNGVKTPKSIEAFLRQEKEWDLKAKLDELNEADKLIYNLHRQACQEGRLLYKDPVTGYKVVTRWQHYLRAKCCGNACRHCPYGHENVSDERKKKRFNSAFYTDIS